MSNVPTLRFKEFNGEWREKKLNDIGKITTGSTPSTSVNEYYNGNKMFVSPADIQGNRYINKTKTTLTDIGFTKGRKVNKNSVCFVCIGSTIGKVAQLSEDSLTNQQINCITSNKYNFNDFIFSLLELKAPRIKLLAGEQAVPQINKSDFSKLKLYLPSKQEQEKIASFLTSLDTKIEQLTKKEELLQQYKKGVMQKIFNQEIRFKDDDGSEFCDWEEKKLKEFGQFYRGHSYNSSNVKDNGLLVLRSSNIQNGSLVLNKDLQFVNKDCNDNIILKKNDIVICMANGSKNLVGKTGVYNDCYNGKVTVGAFCSIFRAKNEFVNYILQTVQYKKYLHIMLAGTNINNLKNSELEELKFMLPKSNEEQIKIANFLSSIDTKIEQTQKQLEQTKEFKKALLQQMFV